MQNLNDYQVIDFILNDSFVQWASGKSSADEVYWLQYIAAYPHKADTFNQAKTIVLHLQIDPVRDLSHQEVDELIQKVLLKNDLLAEEETESFEARIVKWYQRPIFRTAAAVLIGVIALSAILVTAPRYLVKSGQQLAQTSDQFTLRTNETSAPIWVRLPDKTSVILKPGSQLRYPKAFAGLKREVYLIGEAFFEVTKNPHQPFLVYANEMTTRVLGTSFTVKAFKGDKDFKVIVNTGKVAVFANTEATTTVDNKSSVLVIPNQQATLHRKDAVLIKNDLEKPLTLSKEVSKVVFDFNETPFAKVVGAIKDAYGVNITYNEKNLASCPLTASLTDLPLYEKLDLICKAVEANYTLTDGEIYIDGKGCHQ